MINNWTPADTIGLLGQWQENMPTEEYVSYRAGGRAQYAYRPYHVEDLSRCLAQIPAEVPVLMVGKATNLLFSDEGFRGVVILLPEMVRQNRHASFFEVSEEGNEGVLSLSAALSCPKAAQIAVASGFVGLEFFAGIPGSIGGALVMNAGSKGSSTWDHVIRAKLMNRQGECFYITPDQATIGYRKVVLPYKEEVWFMGADFKLAYGDVQQAKAVIEEMLSWRKTHQPLLLPNAGSVFKNPEGDSAGRLIESCDLKGFSIGDAEVSLCHANFIVNKGKATATDIIAVMRHVRKTVQEKTGVYLEPEVKIIGEVV